MPKPFVPLTLPQFRDMLARFPFSRAVSVVHMHHTWRPNRAQYKGLASIDAMHEFHTKERGFSDIAQHITIAPDGTIWTGRNWNKAPASATGHNGSEQSGPFMFEMIGDFDTGQDPFDDPQREHGAGGHRGSPGPLPPATRSVALPSPDGTEVVSGDWHRPG